MELIPCLMVLNNTNFLAGLTCSWILSVEKHLPKLDQLCALSRSPHSLSLQGVVE